MITREEGLGTVLEPRQLHNFVETQAIKELTDRALAYIAAGFPLHFRGASGTGKTTLALHVASKVGRPVVMLHGDEEVSTSGLVGGEYGYRMRRVVDNFIHSVLKTEEELDQRWVDNRLTLACKYGFCLVYDEFTRSRPEANNVLLSVLQEKMLDLPAARGEEGYLKVAADFTAIFTSNPQEYAGVYRGQDALMDRMVTLDLDYFDEETEVAITAAKSGLSWGEAARIVRVVRALRESAECEYAPTVRAPIIIAKTLRVLGDSATAGNEVFRRLCLDVLTSTINRQGSRAQSSRGREMVAKLVDQYC